MSHRHPLATKPATGLDVGQGFPFRVKAGLRQHDPALLLLANSRSEHRVADARGLIGGWRTKLTPGSKEAAQTSVLSRRLARVEPAAAEAPDRLAHNRALSRTQPNGPVRSPIDVAATVAGTGLICRRIALISHPCPYASHARGRWFETSRAHHCSDRSSASDSRSRSEGSQLRDFSRCPTRRACAESPR